MTGLRTDLTGTAQLTGFALRRERTRILLWVVGIVGLVVMTAASVKGLYPTQADLDEAAAASEGNAAAIVFNGPAQSLDTVGGQVAFQVGSMGLVVVALMSLLMVGRLTRGEEEAGRLEMVRSLPVGSQAPTAAASLAVAVINAAVGLLVTGALLGLDLPVGGAVTFGASFVLVGLVFAGVALVAAQISENTRVVYGMSGAVLGAAFVLRAVGDIGDGTISWFSPIGWAQKARPFAGEQWWPFLPLVVAIAALLGAAKAVNARRDLGGGIVAPRPGRATAAPSLGHPLGLAVRMQRGSVIGWSTGILVIGAAYGSLAEGIDDFVGDNEALAEMLARAGGATITDSYLATCFIILALTGAGFSVQSALRLRSEETALRVEPLLATPVSRWRWAASHLTVAFGGSVILLAVAGGSVGLVHGLVSGDLAEVPRLLGASLAHAPAMWVMVGITTVLVGLVPRAVAMAWAVLSLCFVVGLLGELLGLPGWMRDVSPFEHVPQLPAADLAVLPLAVLTALATGLTGIGLAGLRHRDIG